MSRSSLIMNGVETLPVSSRPLRRSNSLMVERVRSPQDAIGRPNIVAELVEQGLGAAHQRAVRGNGRGRSPLRRLLDFIGKFVCIFCLPRGNRWLRLDKFAALGGFRVAVGGGERKPLIGVRQALGDAKSCSARMPRLN